jgi:hypothetical protein
MPAAVPVPASAPSTPYVPEFGELPPLGPAAPPRFAPASVLATRPRDYIPAPPPPDMRLAHGGASHSAAWTAKRRAFWVGAAGCVAAIVVGVSVAGFGLVQASRPQTTVEQYFSALEAGRSAQALSLGDVPQGDRSYLTEAVLRRQLERAKIEAVGIKSVQRKGSNATVYVNYKVVSKDESVSVDDAVLLRKDGYRWKLTKTAVPTTVNVSVAKTRVSVAGTAVPTKQVLFFPGVVPLETNSDVLGFDLTSTLVSFDATGSLNVGVQVRAAKLPDVLAAVDSALATCAPVGATTDPTCPLAINSVGFIPGSLKGTITTKASADKPSVKVGSAASGVIEVTGQFVMDATWSELDFNNRSQPKSSAVTLQYHAWVPLTVPLTAYWTSVGT